MIAAAVAAALTGVIGQVTLRGLESPPAGDVVAVTADGVTVRGEAMGDTIIGWDRIRSVGGEHADEAEPFLGVAERLWRARVRIERGDIFSAEPLLEEPFEFYEGRGGPTAAMVAEALLRARLRRGAQIAAVRPWIALLSAREQQASGPAQAHGDWSMQAGLGEVIDSTTGLAPALPPVWFDWPSVVSFASAEGLSRPSDSALSGAAALRALYVHAARFESGWKDEFPSVDASSRAVAITLEIVRARTGTPAQRDAARTKIRTALNSPMEPWLEAWYRVGLGRSLAMEDDDEMRLLAVSELLVVPARLASAHPYLAGMALADASLILRDLGLTTGADTLRDELTLLYPDHPAVTWYRLQEGSKARGDAIGSPRASDGDFTVAVHNVADTAQARRLCHQDVHGHNACAVVVRSSAWRFSRHP